MTEEEFYDALKRKRPERSHVEIVEHTGNIGYRDKLKFRCLKHDSVFKKSVASFLCGGGHMGCPECKVDAEEAKKREKGEVWLAKLHEKLGHSNYEMVGKWERSNIPVEMRCKKHNEFFTYYPTSADAGTESCKECFKDRHGYYRNGTLETFLETAREVHGEGKYEYEESTFTKFNNKMKMYCPEHDTVFWIAPTRHVRGHTGCEDCKWEKVSIGNGYKMRDVQQKLDDRFGRDSFKVLGRVKEKGADPKWRIVCKKHDKEFLANIQSVRKNDNPCPECISEAHNSWKIADQKLLIARAISIHGDRYDYSKVAYEGCDLPVEIVCKKHNVPFWQTFGNHYKSIDPCPKCSTSGSSLAEKEVLNFIEENYEGEVVANTRSIGDDRHELDIYLPDIGLGVEYNGCYYHCDLNKHRNYHKIKRDYFKSHNISVLFVWEHDWSDKVRQEILKRIILRKINASDEPKYNARQLKVNKGKASEVKDFLDRNHLQGHTKGSNLTYTLNTSEGLIVAAMCFKKTSGEYELTRYATGGNVRGGFMKLLNAFKEDVGKGVVCNSFCDLQTFDGKTYELAGFSPVKSIPPDYKVWHRLLGVTHKGNWRRTSIPKRLDEIGKAEQVNFNPDKSIDPRSERDIQRQVHALRLFDCGKVKYQLIT